MLRKLGSYPRQNGLALALREISCIERTLFILDWPQNIELRRRVHVALNKGEARNALARAVFLYRLGQIRDRSFEAQRYRRQRPESGHCRNRTVEHSLSRVRCACDACEGLAFDVALLPHLSPLG